MANWRKYEDGYIKDTDTSICAILKPAKDVPTAWWFYIYDSDMKVHLDYLTGLKTPTQAMATANMHCRAYLAEQKEKWSEALSEWNYYDFQEEDENEQSGTVD